MLLGALQKLADPAPVIQLLADRGMSTALVWPALVFDAVSGVLLALGVCTRPLALLTAAYCAFTSLFHFLPDNPWQMTIFVKNWTIAGGFLMLFAHGPGRYALRG